MSDRQRQATNCRLDTHHPAYQAVLRTWRATLTADDPEQLTDAIEAYLQARIDAGKVIMSEKEGG
jgi:hypothetical protein